MEFDGDLFCGLDESSAEQQEPVSYDKILETRKSANFVAESFEGLDEVQLVEKEVETNLQKQPIVEKKPKL